jgi:hypothetical protein
MFFENKHRRQIIFESVLNGAYSGLDNEALLKRFPILDKWKEGIPLKQVRKIIHQVLIFLRGEVKGKVAKAANGQISQDFKIGLFLDKNEIITKRVSIMGLIGTLSNTVNEAYKNFK